MASKTFEKICGHGKVIRNFLTLWNRIVFRTRRVNSHNCQCRDDRSVSQERGTLRTANSRGPLPFQEVNRCAVGGRGKYARGRKELVKVIVDASKPGIL